MENLEQQNHHLQIRTQIIDVVSDSIRRNFAGDLLLITLSEALPDHSTMTDKLHPDTLRSLCHYASVVIGEQTKTAIAFSPSRTVETAAIGYAKESVEIIENEFIVCQRAEPLPVKKVATFEPLTPYDIERRNKNPQIDRGDNSNNTGIEITPPNRSRRSRQIPSFVTRMTRRGF